MPDFVIAHDLHAYRRVLVDAAPFIACTDVAEQTVRVPMMPQPVPALAIELDDACESRMKTLSVGIGCRLHRTAGQIEAAVRAALGSQLRFDRIARVASIDSKAADAGLLEFCARHALPLTFFSREQIATLQVAEPSAAAKTHLGVDGVCEPCALLAAYDPAWLPSGPRLLVGKTIHEGVTVAIATTAAALAHYALHQQDPS